MIVFSIIFPYTVLFIEPDEAPPSDGRILFKKPVKKRELDDNSEKTDESKKKKKIEKKKEKSLLSFDDENEDGD